MNQQFPIWPWTTSLEEASRSKNLGVRPISSQISFGRSQMHSSGRLKMPLPGVWDMKRD